MLADRGLYARWLFHAIVHNDWHPLLRSNQRATICPTGQTQRVWVRDLGGQEDQRWQGTGTDFSRKENRLMCTLVAW